MADTTHSQAGTASDKATLDDPARLLGAKPGNIDPTTDSAAVGVVDTSTASGRFNRFDNPWLNPKLIWGVVILGGILFLGFIGGIIWNTELVFTGSTPSNCRRLVLRTCAARKAWPSFRLAPMAQAATFSRS